MTLEETRLEMLERHEALVLRATEKLTKLRHGNEDQVSYEYHFEFYLPHMRKALWDMLEPETQLFLMPAPGKVPEPWLTSLPSPPFSTGTIQRLCPTLMALGISTRRVGPPVYGSHS